MSPDVAWENFDTPILFFDGYCHLCQWSVRFVLRHERAPELRFAPLDSAAAKELLPKGIATSQSVILYKSGITNMHSSAALVIARYLKLPYRLLHLFMIIPRPLRDAIYRWVSGHRYKWFGKSESCMVPDETVSKRFLY